MAKRKAKTTHRRRRSRISGFGGGGGKIQTIAMVAAGAIAGSYIFNNVVKRQTDPDKAKKLGIMVGAGMAIAGAFAEKVIKGPTGTALGHGLSAIGAVKALGAAGLQGIGGMEDSLSGFIAEIPDDGMSGYDDDGMSGYGDDSAAATFAA